MCVWWSDCTQGTEESVLSFVIVLFFTLKIFVLPDPNLGPRRRVNGTPGFVQSTRETQNRRSRQFTEIGRCKPPILPPLSTAYIDFRLRTCVGLSLCVYKYRRVKHYRFQLGSCPFTYLFDVIRGYYLIIRIVCTFCYGWTVVPTQNLYMIAPILSSGSSDTYCTINILFQVSVDLSSLYSRCIYAIL